MEEFIHGELEVGWLGASVADGGAGRRKLSCHDDILLGQPDMELEVHGPVQNESIVGLNIELFEGDIALKVGAFVWQIADLANQKGCGCSFGFHDVK